MQSPYEKGKKEYIERSVAKLSSVYNIIKNNPNFYNDSDTVEESYHILKQLRDSSAIFNDINVYKSVSLLLKEYKITGIKYAIDQDKARIIFEGIDALLKQLLNDGSQKSVSSSVNITKQKVNVLVIDNDVYFTDWIIEELTDTEFNIIIVANMHEVIPTILKHNIFVLIIDMMLPDNLGFEIVERIRNNEWISSIPIIATTQSHQEKQIIDIINTNVDELIVKPFYGRYLLAKLKSIYYRKNLVNKTYSPSFYISQHEAMDNLIKKEWIRFQRFQSYFSVLIVKLDVYDKHLSNFGDEIVLSFMNDLYQRISDSIRTYDEIRMWSANSYMLLLPATKLEGAALVGKRILNILKDHSNRILTSNILVGVIESEIDYKTSEDMIRRLEKDINFATSNVVHAVGYIDDKNKLLSDKKHYRILIIDEDPVPPTILTNHFKSEEWEIEICSNGALAMEKVLELKPDIVICETRLEELDGYSFCYQLRQFPNLKNLVFIFLSKQTLTNSIIRGFQVGADDYLVKPFSADEIEIRIKRCIQRLSNG